MTPSVGDMSEAAWEALAMDTLGELGLAAGGGEADRVRVLGSGSRGRS